jgi:Concanavalin A-like lectin/glucanases superfamily/Secretion system C-terminal sorting domain
MKIFYTFVFLCFLSVGLDAQSGLLAHFKFDGNTADSSGLSNHALAVGPKLCPDRFGAPNKAIRFSSATDRLSAPNHPSLNTNAYSDFTISLWLKRRELNYANYNPILFILGQNTLNYALIIDPEFTGGVPTPQHKDKLLFINYTSSGSYSQIFENTTISDTAWHQVTYVIHQSEGKFDVYYDGNQVGTDTYNPKLLTTSSLYIGSHPTQNWAFLGDLDDVRLYNRALSLAEIKGLVTTKTETNQTNIQITPTICNDFVQFDSPEFLETEIVLFDISGKTVLTSALTLPGKLDLAPLTNGVYFIEVKKGKKRLAQQKIILQKN